MKTLCISLVILMRTLALGADALPYAELEPWVDSSVWQLPQPKSIEEFLEKYIFPQKGNTVVNKQWRDKGLYFYSHFYGMVVNNRYFTVVEKDINIEETNLELPMEINIVLCNKEQERLHFSIQVSDSEQMALNNYPKHYLSTSGNLNIQLLYAKHINFGIFCRYIQEKGFLEYIKDGYDVRINGRNKWDILQIGKQLYSLLIGETDYLPQNTEEFMVIQDLYRVRNEEKKRKIENERAARKLVK